MSKKCKGRKKRKGRLSQAASERFKRSQTIHTEVNWGVVENSDISPDALEMCQLIEAGLIETYEDIGGNLAPRPTAAGLEHLEAGTAGELLRLVAQEHADNPGMDDLKEGMASLIEVGLAEVTYQGKVLSPDEYRALDEDAEFTVKLISLCEE